MPKGNIGLQATEEQRLAVEKFATGRPLKIIAFAGAGKTTTLKLLADSRQTRGIYLAFNKAIADEARETFPAGVDCRTGHSLAFQTMLSSFQSTQKMAGNIGAKQLADVMELGPRLFHEMIRLDGTQQAHLSLGTVRRFCQSADQQITADHVPAYGRLLGAKEEDLKEIRSWVVGQANLLWNKMTDPQDPVPLGHDGYLKLWALGHPNLAADYILLDEAQDTNDVVLGVLQKQDSQIVYVGDPYQQIDEWPAAVNAMEKVRGCEEAALTQSFRFGDAIADAASNVLSTLGEPRRICGNPAIKSTIVGSGTAGTVLARTNATVIVEVLEAMKSGRKPCVIGGTADLKELLRDVYELKAGRPGSTSEFFGFENWPDVLEFSETEEGESIGTFVQLVEQHGEGKLWAAATTAVEAQEDNADIILSTAHKAKGREWDSVRLSDDFASSGLGSHPNAASEVRLFYIAMTRAKNTLIITPEVLDTFSTEAWKPKGGKSQPSPAQPSAPPAATTQTQTPPTKASEPSVPPIVTARSLAEPSEPPAATAPPPRTEPPEPPTAPPAAAQPPSLIKTSGPPVRANQRQQAHWLGYLLVLVILVALVYAWAN